MGHHPWRVGPDPAAPALAAAAALPSAAPTAPGPRCGVGPVLELLELLELLTGAWGHPGAQGRSRAALTRGGEEWFIGMQTDTQAQSSC